MAASPQVDDDGDGGGTDTDAQWSRYRKALS